MPNWWNDKQGSAALELALVLPLMLLLAVTSIEVGRAVYQASAIEKAVRAGALYAAHAEMPLSVATRQTIMNIVKTGNATGTGPYLIEGWSAASASVLIETLSFDLGGGASVPVIRVTAQVPLAPLAPGLDTVFPIRAYTHRISHEQGYIGS